MNELIIKKKNHFKFNFSNLFIYLCYFSETINKYSLNLYSSSLNIIINKTKQIKKINKKRIKKENI